MPQGNKKAILQKDNFAKKCRWRWGICQKISFFVSTVLLYTIPLYVQFFLRRHLMNRLDTTFIPFCLTRCLSPLLYALAIIIVSIYLCSALMKSGTIKTCRRSGYQSVTDTWLSKMMADLKTSSGKGFLISTNFRSGTPARRQVAVLENSECRGKFGEPNV